MSSIHQIKNEITGQVINFLKTGSSTHGELLEMEAVYASFSDEPPLHFHPHQEEFFEVLAGELTVRMNSEVRTYQVNEIVHIKAGIPHSMWNAGYADTKVNWKVYPALETAELLTTLTKLANRGETNEAGIPSFLLMIYILKKYQASFRLSKLNGSLLNTLCLLCAPLFLLFGYKQKLSKFNL